MGISLCDCRSFKDSMTYSIPLYNCYKIYLFREVHLCTGCEFLYSTDFQKLCTLFWRVNSSVRILNVDLFKTCYVMCNFLRDVLPGRDVNSSTQQSNSFLRDVLPCRDVNSSPQKSVFWEMCSPFGMLIPLHNSQILFWEMCSPVGMLIPLLSNHFSRDVLPCLGC